MGRLGTCAAAVALTIFLLDVRPGRAADNSEAVPPATTEMDSPDLVPDAEATPRRVIEEIVVTAQRREQLIEDVPISMSVLDSDFIAEQGIGDVREALLFTPNARVDSAGFFAAPRIRGFTFNNNNKAFEPPAGLALDGVPYTRVGYFTSALFDVERVEVLRGPQGISISGAPGGKIGANRRRNRSFEKRISANPNCPPPAPHKGFPRFRQISTGQQ